MVKEQIIVCHNVTIIIIIVQDGRGQKCVAVAPADVIVSPNIVGVNIDVMWLYL